MAEILQSLLEDWIRYRWRDTVALVLIFGSFAVLILCHDPVARDAAKGCVGAGLIMLDPRAMQPGPRNGAGGTITMTEKTTATLPVQTSAQAPAQASPAPPAGWPTK